MTTPPDTAPAPQPVTVVKLGGSTLGAHDTSLRDIAAARKDGHRIVVVHGGGATISAWLERAGITPRFVRGLRATDAASLEIVVAVLAGVVNKQLVADLSALGAPAVGLSGADSLILQARRFDDELGFVGSVERVNPFPLEELLGLGYLPVVAPIAIESTARTPSPGTAPAAPAHAAPPAPASAAGQLLNVNADTAAGDIAAALHAARLVFLTDVDAVLDAARRPLAHLTPDDARALIASGAAAGGMIPKLEAALRAAAAGCATHIINGTRTAALAPALAGSPSGTTIA